MVALTARTLSQKNAHRLRPAVVLLLLTAIALSACGSTAQVSDPGISGEAVGTSPSGPELGDGSSDPALAGQGIPTDVSTDGQRGDDASGPSVPGSPETARGSNEPADPVVPSPRGTEAVPPPGRATGTGFTEREIYIGYGTWNNFEAWASSFGYDGLGQGDNEAQAQAIADDINARGGIAGREVVLVFHDYEDGQNPQTNAQAACARWTEDRPVFAVINRIGSFSDETLASCLAQHQIPLIQLTAQVIRPASVYAKYSPYLYAPAQPALERAVPPWMERLAANDYFESWNANNASCPPSSEAKIGLLSLDPYSAEWARVVSNALSKKGHEVAATYENANPGQMNNAVLRFRRECVTHVFGQGTSVFFFATQAESQGYRPRYAVNTNNNLGAWEDVVPEQQRRGAVGVGWDTQDGYKARDPNDASDAEVRCRKIMDDAGLDTTNQTAYTLMLRSCDGFHFLVEAIEQGGLSPKGMRQAIAAFGSMPSASTFAMSFPGGRADGASAARDLAYTEDCRCFAYLSKRNHGM